MAYETGTATDSNNLIQKLSTFLLAQGFTINRQDNDGTYERLNIVIAGEFFNIYMRNVVPASYDRCILTMSTAYSAGAANGAQTNETEFNQGGDTRCEPIFTNGITAYHFFFSSNVCNVVIESDPGKYCHFMFGQLSKFGTWAGGSFIDAIEWRFANRDDANSLNHVAFADSGSATSSYGNHVRWDKDTVPQYARGSITKQSFFAVSGSGYVELGGSVSMMAGLLTQTPSNSTSRAIAMPLQYWINIATTAPYGLVPVGFVPTVKQLSIKLLAVGSLVDTDWLVFPMAMKKSPLIDDNELNSGWLGIIIKQVL